MKSLLLALFAGLSAGCIADRSGENALRTNDASVQGTRRGRDSYYVTRVDTVSIRRPTLEKDWGRPVAVAPGERNVVVRYESADPSLSLGLRMAEAVLKVQLLPGVRYAPDGRDEGRSVRMWIKRSDTGDRVTDEVLAKKDELPPLKPPSFVPPSPQPQVGPMPTGGIPR